MKARELTIAERMTRTPHVIGVEQSLTTAHQLMRTNGIRHLPVLHGGKLVGVVSQRDLHFVESLRDVNPDDVPVEEAMTQDVYTVTPKTLLREVVSEMAERKLGSAVVVDGLRNRRCLHDDRRPRHAGRCLDATNLTTHAALLRNNCVEHSSHPLWTLNLRVTLVHLVV
jgi:acetoin utilization protein AcuB